MVGEAIFRLRRECELELRLDRLTLCACSLPRLRHTGLRSSDAFGLERARGGIDPTGASRPPASTCRTLSSRVRRTHRWVSRHETRQERVTPDPLRRRLQEGIWQCLGRVRPMAKGGRRDPWGNTNLE